MRLKPVLLAPRGRRLEVTKSILWFLILIFVEIAIHDFSVWLKTGSNPPDIIRFRSNTGTFFRFVRPKFLTIYCAIKQKE